MSRRLALFVLRLYPADWRERYEDEVLALVQAAGPTWRVLPDLVRGAASEWIVLASSPDRRRLWLGRPSGRRLFASAAVLVPIAAMVVSASIAEVLAPRIPDDSWTILAAACLTVVMLPVAMWRFVFAGMAKRWFTAKPEPHVVMLQGGPVGIERRLWFGTLLAMQLATQVLFVGSVQALPWPPSWIRAVTLLGYFTLPTSFLITLCLQSAARRYERVTGLPLHQPRRKPSVPRQPLGL